MCRNSRSNNQNSLSCGQPTQNLCRNEVFSDEQKLTKTKDILYSFNRLQRKSWRFPLKALSTKMRYAFYNIPFQIKLFVASEWIFDRTTNMHKGTYAAESKLYVFYYTIMDLAYFESKIMIVIYCYVDIWFIPLIYYVGR